MKTNIELFPWLWGPDVDEGHPDEHAVLADTLIPEVRKKLPVTEYVRYGSCYALPDGDWLFPYEYGITRIITLDSPDW